MNADAARYYAGGRSVLQSWLPFWVAVTVERLLEILLPVLGIAMLIRFARRSMPRRWKRSGATTRRCGGSRTGRGDGGCRGGRLRGRLEVPKARWRGCRCR